MAKFNFSDEVRSGKILMERIKAVIVDPYYYERDIKKIINSSLLVNAGKNPKSYTKTVGYLAGTIKDNKLIVSISFCMPEDFFNFDKNIGKNKVCSRVLKGVKINKLHYNNSLIIKDYSDVNYFMPYSIKKCVDHFTNRCKKYFKGIDNE